MPEVMQVVPKTYDLILWLIPRIREFPRDQRFLLGDRIQSEAMDILALLIEANYTRERAQILRRANLGLEKLRFFVRMASDLHYLSQRRYQHAAERIDEVGRLVGGWTKADRKGTTPRAVEESSLDGPRGATT